MARNAIFARMETICAEVMEMPEIFLADDDDDDDEQCENLDVDEPDDEASDDIPASAEDCDREEGAGKDESTGKAVGKSSGVKADADREKGVSVKVNCDDKKQQRYAKWISRALRTAVNPIVSRFNLNLKVNLDLNVANKPNATQKNDPKNSNEPAKPDSKPKPTLHQQQRRADLTRIKELEKDNRHLEKVFGKIVTAYTDMKTKLSEKTTELDVYQNKALNEEAKVRQLSEERNKLKEQSEHETSVNKQLVEEKLQLLSKISETQRKLDTLNKEFNSKCMLAKELESKLSQSQEHHKNTIEMEKTRFSAVLSEKQAVIDSREEQLQLMKTELQSLQDSKASFETQFQQTIQQYQHKSNQLELKIVELMRQNRDLNTLVGRGLPSLENSTVMEPTSHSTGYGYTCPLCGTPFKNLGDLQIHTENCGT
ncbi:kinesin-related protein 4-like [Ochlerotatus camptorhynchus]|uniref:kinesin-related protein 4-like n=1 Tax=Ochlerotatus camptorhynchus TaxID=644619 RepID=UPI0031DF3626